MRHIRPVVYAISLTALLVLGWKAYANTARSEVLTAKTQLSPATNGWASAQLEALTLEQKVSQLFASYAYGHFKSADDPTYQRLTDLVENFEVGGLIFFQGDPWSQAILANDLQHRARLPLLVSQDMEWGAGMRVERTTRGRAGP